MSERLIVSVAPPTNHPDVLRVEDAFEHVIELFELARASNADGEPDVGWKLVSVSMNSPLTVVAEAYSPKPGVAVEAAARSQKRRLAENLKILQEGRMPRAWANHQITRNTANSFRKRRGLGVTKVVLQDSNKSDPDLPREIEIPELQDFAFEPEMVLQLLVDAPKVGLAPVKPKEQVGSIEGSFIEVGTYYGHPAIQVLDRRTKRKVWCVVSEEQQRGFAEAASFTDVWEGRRIRVSGRLEYDAAGELHKLTATKLVLIDPSKGDLRLDSEFTGGKTAAQYLDDFREGNLG